MKSYAPFFSTTRTLVRASGEILRTPKHFALALIGALLFFALYFFVPVWIVPGNSPSFELSLISPLNFFLLSLLALMTGILFSLEWYSLARTKGSAAVKTAGGGGVGILASMAGGILAAASCACSVGIFLGLIGLGGGALFVAAHQTLVVLVFVGITAFGLYFSARRAAGICATCRA